MGSGSATNGRQTPAGFLFDASDTVPAYLSRKDHRRLADGSRNKWRILPADEYGVFVASHKEGYLCSKDHSWGVGSSFELLGTNKERIAKFPRAENPTDERHGYPVSARDPRREFEHRPPPEITTRWRDQQLITEIDKARIDRGKV